MPRTAKRALVLAVMALAMTGLTACNAVKGLGRDIQSVGEAADREM